MSEVDSQLRVENTMLQVHRKKLTAEVALLHEIVLEQRGLVNMLLVLVAVLMTTLGIIAAHAGGVL